MAQIANRSRSARSINHVTLGAIGRLVRWIRLSSWKHLQFSAARVRDILLPKRSPLTSWHAQTMRRRLRRQQVHFHFEMLEVKVVKSFCFFLSLSSRSRKKWTFTAQIHEPINQFLVKGSADETEVHLKCKNITQNWPKRCAYLIKFEVK